jgi:F-type H+-transporting ATPase subunit epsilon
MAKNKLRLKIITPDHTKHDEDAELVIIRTTLGELGFMARHMDCSAVLDYGVLRFFNDDLERRIAIFGGIAQMRDNVLTVLANDAEWPEDIDLARVEAEREQTERRLRDSVDNLEIQRDQILMRRTLVQMEVSAYPLISPSIPEDNSNINNNNSDS